MKWCWSRMPDGVVGWSVYEGFQIGERESNLARNAFDTFIPMSAESTARRNIIVDFFDLLAAVAAHGKTNGMAGRKLSRLAGWWAFNHSDDGKGFEGGYKSWAMAADATSHLFFAYLRTLSPEANPAMSLIERIPRSLQALLASTEYPPETPTLMQTPTSRVVMLVDSVSPTPFALLRRAKNFAYRDADKVLREFSEFQDPVDALTEECKRVLYAISSTNSSAARSRHGKLTRSDESWSAFSNLGFGDMDEKALQKTPNGMNGANGHSQGGLRSEPRSRNADHARPMTPSWADFLSSGFAEDEQKTPTLLMPPNQVLPPLGSRAQTPSYIPGNDENVSEGELAAIVDINLDDAFWWVWMISLANEEPAERKAVFGRCAVIETSIMHGRWLVMEEQVKGASPDPENGAYIAPKKSFFSFTKRGRLGRKKSTNARPPQTSEPERLTSATPSRTSLAPAQQSKIKQAAAALKNQEAKDEDAATRRGRNDDPYSSKTNSTLTMGLQTEAGPAMKWMGAYDKHTLRAQYLGDTYAGTGASREDLLFRQPSSSNVNGDAASVITSPAPALSPDADTFQASRSERELPAVPSMERTITSTTTPQEEQPAAPLPPLPPASPELTALPVPAQTTQREAENVPIPEVASPTAMDKEMGAEPSSSSTRNRVSRKPVSQAHPAYRPRSNDQPASPQTPTSPTQSVAAIAAARAMKTSPESQKSGTIKPKKQGAPAGSSGLKKMFGRSKKDTTNRQSMDVSQSNGLAPPDQEPLRRLSLIRKKHSQVPTAKESRTDLPSAGASELEAVPIMPASHGKYDNSSTAISTTESHEQRHADQEFARFDQGPVDMPMATPQTSQPEIMAPQAQRVISPRMDYHAGPESGYEAFETPMEQPDPIVDDTDAQSEATMEEPAEPTAQEKDRWATIRENAARRAQRASEEQSMQSRPSQSARTEDGETSGEESKSRNQERR